MRPSKSSLKLLFVAGAAALALSACREDEALSALPATMAALGGAGGAYDPLVDSGYVPLGRPVSYDQSWDWAERGYGLDRAFYETPPDYGFAYDGVEPWVWRTDDRWAMYADPYAQDDWRYYYYQPDAPRPYLIRDDQYGYGFDDLGRLVVIYDLLGQLMPQSFLADREALATDYYRRAYAMRAASLRAQPIVVVQEIWVERAPSVWQDQSAWIAAASRSRDWTAYRARTDERFVRAFDDERRRRAPLLAAVERARPRAAGPQGEGARHAAAPALAPKGLDRADLKGSPGAGRAAERHDLQETAKRVARERQGQAMRADAQAQQRAAVEQRRAEGRARRDAEADVQRQGREHRQAAEQAVQQQRHAERAQHAEQQRQAQQQRQAEAQQRQAAAQQRQAQAQRPAQSQKPDAQAERGRGRGGGDQPKGQPGQADATPNGGGASGHGGGHGKKG